jgi:AraC-like DNA-binding protein
MADKLVFFISTIGWFNGLLLSAYFLFFYKNRKLSGLLFGAMLLALSLRVAKSVIWWFNPQLPVIWVQLGLVACLFIGPLLYYFLKASTYGVKQMPARWSYTLVGYAMVSLVLLLFFSARPYYPIWRQYIIPFIYLQWFGYTIVSGWLIRPMVHKLIRKGVSLQPNEKWILGIYIGSLVTATTYLLSYFGIKLSYIAGPISFSVLLYLNSLILLYRKRTDELFQSEPEKYANKKLDAQLASDSLTKLEELMLSQEVHANPDLKLNDLAALLNLSGHQLSQLLNERLGKNFNTYINEYRIRRACEIISKDRNLKLEAVGYEVGFNSKSAFFSAFKKYTGKTPNLFKQEQIQSVSGSDL